MKMKIAGTLTTAMVMTALSAASSAHADANAGEQRDSGQVVTGWNSDDAGAQSVSGADGATAGAAGYACWGYFSDIVRINNTIQYGGWTQCEEIHHLELKIVLWRYIDSSRTWKLVDSVDNARWGQLVNAVDDPSCVPTSKSHYYRMQTYPLMDGIQMVNYAAYSESKVIPCRVDL